MPRPARETLRLVALLLALDLVLFGGLALAIHYYPHRYHWRTGFMSELAEPSLSPHAYLIACASLALTGICLLPFPALLRARLAACAPVLTLWSGRLLYIAAVLLILSGLIPGRIPALGYTHDVLGHVYGGFIAVATIGYACAAFRLPRRFRWLAIAGIVCIFLPFAGFAAGRLFLFLGEPFAGSSLGRALDLPAWTGLPFWEWIAGIGTCLFLGIFILGLPAAPAVRPGSASHRPARPARRP